MWKPELDALFRYGAWMTSTRQFWMSIFMQNRIGGLPENFVQKLLLHMANSHSPQMMMLHSVHMNFEELPIPAFIMQLFNEKEQYKIGDRFLFESIQLETENGQILHIFDGEFIQYDFGDRLRLFVMNKMDWKNLFQILIDMDSSRKFIQQFYFSQWKIQSFDDIANFIKAEYWLANDSIEQNGHNKLEVKSDIPWNHNLNLFLLRGAAFTQFRHFEMKPKLNLCNQSTYVDFLISYIANTKHPEDFLESINMNLDCSSLLIEKFWTIFYKGIPEVGISINLENNKLHILSAKIGDNKSEFTLANIPTNGAYLFDVKVKFGNEGIKQIVGIKIQKRKNDGNIVELKCEDQIGLGMKRKASNDDEEDGPTCSAKLMKK